MLPLLYKHVTVDFRNYSDHVKCQNAQTHPYHAVKGLIEKLEHNEELSSRIRSLSLRIGSSPNYSKHTIWRLLPLLPALTSLSVETGHFNQRFHGVIAPKRPFCNEIDRGVRFVLDRSTNIACERADTIPFTLLPCLHLHWIRFPNRQSCPLYRPGTSGHPSFCSSQGLGEAHQFGLGIKSRRVPPCGLKGFAYQMLF